MSRHEDYIAMTTQARALAWLKGISSDGAKSLVDQLIEGYSYLFMDKMDRLVRYRERTAFFDVDPYASHDRLNLRAWPIGLDTTTGEPLVDFYNDAADIPSYVTALTYGSDYRVWTGEEDQGRVEFRRKLIGEFQAIKAVWSGGMAVHTLVFGSGGQCATPPGLTSFLDASATFIDDGVKPGMSLVITDNKNGNAGTYQVGAVPDNFTLEFVAAAWPGGAGPFPADEVYEIPEAGFTGLYPDIELALIAQIVFHWKQKDKMDVEEISVQGSSGMNVQFTRFKPLQLLPTVEDALNAHRLVVYP